MEKEKIISFLKKNWHVIAIIIIIILGFQMRLLDYRWPYLRNIDSYLFYRQMDEIVQNNGILPINDTLMTAPGGGTRSPGQEFYVYLGAYSYMFFRIFSPSTELWQFLVWFPPLLASLMAIPMYFIGRLLYDKKAGVLAAFFIVFDISILSRTLGGDPDSDAIILLMPLVVMALFLLTYKFINTKKLFNKRAFIYSVITGIVLAIWGRTWGGGYWYVVWLITGFVLLKILTDFLRSRKIKDLWHDTKYIIFSYLTIIIIFFSLSVPFFGVGYITGTFTGPFSFGQIKEEAGREFPNVYVSVQELQSPGDWKDIIQKTSAINFDQNPIAMFVSPFFLMIYSLLYLSYSYLKRRQHLDTLILFSIWFVGPFLATIISVRFSILFSAPIAIGSAIILSKLFSIVSREEKLED